MMLNKEITKEDVIDSLKSVIDPEIGINIVDLGLIYNISINDDLIEIAMTLTTPGCPMHGSISDWVKRILELSFPEKKIIVNLVWEPVWTPEKMSEKARKQLGI
ncbi:MAG: metal-sulfur cluster assembly factor [Ignavibacteria bacterium]